MKILEITLVRRGSCIKWTNVKKRTVAQIVFLREWSPHLRRCYDLVRGISDYLFVNNDVECVFVCVWRDGVGGRVYVSGRSEI